MGVKMGVKMGQMQGLFSRLCFCTTGPPRSAKLVLWRLHSNHCRPTASLQSRLSAVARYDMKLLWIVARVARVLCFCPGFFFSSGPTCLLSSYERFSLLFVVPSLSYPLFSSPQLRGRL